jgi:phage gp36-like protein
MQAVAKQPSEQLKLPMAFPGTVVALIDIGATPRGLVAGAAPLGTIGSVFGGKVTATVDGGTDGERYLLTARAQLDDDQELETELEIVVIDGTWIMPDGGAPYLTIEEFVQRFGLPEVVRMTDAEGTGRIDRELLVAKLIDAQAMVEAHLAGRYQLPLAQVPLIIKKAIADLARASLYPNGAPDGVSDEAKASTRMLERIQSGQFAVPSAAPLAPAEVTSDPVIFSPGERAYPDGLRDF